MPLAYHGTTKAAAQLALAEGLRKPAPAFTEDRRRASRGAEALITVDPARGGMSKAPGYAIPRWYTLGDIPPEAIIEVEVF